MTNPCHCIERRTLVWTRFRPVADGPAGGSRRLQQNLFDAFVARHSPLAAGQQRRQWQPHLSKRCCGKQASRIGVDSPIRQRWAPGKRAFTACSLFTQPSFCVALLRCRAAVCSLMPRMLPSPQAVLPSTVPQVSWFQMSARRSACSAATPGSRLIASEPWVKSRDAAGALLTQTNSGSARNRSMTTLASTVSKPSCCVRVPASASNASTSWPAAPT